MKRIILSLSMLAFAGALIIGGTGAFFSDTETSTGNTFTAGAIDLKIDSSCTYNGVESEECGSWELKDLIPTSDKFFNFSDIKPGDEGTSIISLHVDNNDAWVCAAVSNLASDDNGLTEPESDVDSTGGVGEGELDDEMLWSIWRDDNNNGILDGGEVELASGSPTNGTLALYDSTTGSPLAGESVAYLGVAWTLPEASGNETQTDSLTGDISFSVVQSRNNDEFVCGDVEVPEDDGEVNESDLFVENDKVAAFLSGDWFFYNDSNDTIMSINQFGPEGANEMDSVDGEEGAKMTLHDASGRYNIATYRYTNRVLADIDTLTYRIYDDTASSETPYLHFNVDFNNSDTWQGRLVQVPTGVSEDTWTTVDALAGTWTKTSGNWPAGAVSNGSISGATARTWADIVADYPNAETRATDSFFGIRVGHPGPDGATGFVSEINFDGEVTNFEI